MGRIYRAIDSDGHVLVPLNLWEKYIEPAFRDRAPRLFIDTDGKERLRIDGNAFGGRKGLGTLGAIGARDGVVCGDTMTYNEGKKGGFDPHARIPDMDADGIDAAFFYPSIGLSLSGIADPELVHALYHAYKLWLADYCKPYPDRLFWRRHVAAQDPLGDRLSTSGWLLPRCPQNDAGAHRGSVAADETRGHGRRGDGFLRAELTEESAASGREHVDVDIQIVLAVYGWQGISNNRAWDEKVRLVRPADEFDLDAGWTWRTPRSAAVVGREAAD